MGRILKITSFTLVLIICCLITSGGLATFFSDTTEHYQIREHLELSKPCLYETADSVLLEFQESQSFLLQPGHPIIPAVPHICILPFGSSITNIEVTYHNHHFMHLSKQVQTTPQPQSPEKITTQENSEESSKKYQSMRVYPNEDFTYSLHTGLHEGTIVTYLVIQCYPLRSVPFLNLISYATDIEIQVDYQPSQPQGKTTETFDMVIITPNKYTSLLQPLVDHKNARGLRTYLKTTEDIYQEYTGRDQPEQIKYFIKDALETKDIHYVLLVGGAQDLPARYTHIYYIDPYNYKTEWVFVSDVYYADIYNGEGELSSWDTNGNDVFAEYDWYGNTDDVDLFPDVYLGRLACVTAQEVTTCVNKIITYETQQAYQADWFSNVVLIGGDSLPGDEDAIDEGEYVQQNIMEILDGFTPITVWASTGDLYQASNINTAINTGAGFVFFNGHGNLDIWATHPHESNSWIPTGQYRNDHINALENGDRLPIVISDACYHCTYNVKTDCFGWTFLTNPHGGAIFFLGGTDVDLSYEGVAIITKGVEKLCLELSTNYMKGATTMGELWGQSLISYMSAPLDGMDIITIEENQPFGDPSLQIRQSQPPLQPSQPVGPPTGKPEVTYSFTTSTVDPDDDDIQYLFDWGDDSEILWLGPYSSGEEITISHAWKEQGSFSVKVKARDVYGEESPWSEPCSISIPRAKDYSLFMQLLRGFQHIPFLSRFLLD
jgi:hypothetical protein